MDLHSTKKLVQGVKKLALEMKFLTENLFIYFEDLYF